MAKKLPKLQIYGDSVRAGKKTFLCDFEVPELVA